MKIEGAAALVSGGASGLGAATVRRFVEAGAHVIIADVDQEKGEALARDLGARAEFAKMDVTSPTDVEGAIVRAGALGPLRIAVNCAGVGWAARTVNKEGAPHDLELFRSVIGINLIGTFNVLRLAAAAMAKTEALEEGERGVIVNTASVAAFEGQIGHVAYASSKAGVVGMTLPAARDLSVIGIRVMTIAPGCFETPMLGLLSEATRQALASQIPFPRRFGAPFQYAELVEHIVRNRYLNGETIRIDGALRSPPK